MSCISQQSDEMVIAVTSLSSLSMNGMQPALIKALNGCGKICDCVLTAGCDTQEGRIVCEVYGCLHNEGEVASSAG